MLLLAAHIYRDEVMFLSKWAERVGQVLAPDDNYVAETGELDIWQQLAPDPKFRQDAATTGDGKLPAPPSSAFKSPRASQQKQVECEHCHQLTSSERKRSPSSSMFTTPNSAVVGSSHSVVSTPAMEEVEGHVMETAKNLAKTMQSPCAVRKPEEDVFAFCGKLPEPYKSEKMQKKYEKSKQRVLKILSNHTGIFRATSCGLNIPPDGFTPLMAAAYSNNLQAAQLLWEHGPPDQLLYRNLQGKTAFHIASEMGHLEMVEFFQQRHASHSLLDLSGSTPYGAAMTSPQAKARSNRQQLTSMLYQDNDISILGSPDPVQQRVQSSQSLQLVYGFGDMPGKRIANEDAMVATTFWDGAAALFGVCDGHGDGGRVSEFIAQEFPPAFRGAMSMSGEWQDRAVDICLAVDDKLQSTGLQGGSTAVLALVTPSEIVVSNVGDSRCILIQQSVGSDSTGVEEQLQDLSLKEQEEDRDSPPSTSLTARSDCRVVPLSDDHKPSQEGEMSRIEAAGLTVFEEKFLDNGKEAVIHKVALSETSMLATSRALGDFEYKANKDLSAEEQAVIAVPDVLVHTRDHEADAYLVLACDGVWDVMSNEEVAEFVVESIREYRTADKAVLPAVADRVLARCLELGSTDNMSIVIVALSKTAEMHSVELPERKALKFEPSS